MTLEECRLFIAGHLVEIADGMPSEYKLTLIARNTVHENADIVVTDDDLQLATAAGTALAAKDVPPAASGDEKDEGMP